MPTRFLRISEILGAGGSQAGKFSVADFQRLQNDEVSPPARELVSLLGGGERGRPGPAPLDREARALGRHPGQGFGGGRPL